MLQGWYGQKQKQHTNCMNINVYSRLHNLSKAHISTHIATIDSRWMVGPGRLAGAVLEEDMASVHLSISKHSQLSCLSTGGEVISSFFLCINMLSTFVLFPLLSSFFSSLIYLLQDSLLLRVFLFSFHLIFSQDSTVFFLLVFHSTFLFTFPSPSSAPFRLLCSPWNSSFSNKTKLPTASNTD